MGFTKRTPTQRAHDRERRAATRARMRNQLRYDALLASFLYLGACDKELTRAEISSLSQLLPSLSEGGIRGAPKQLHSMQPNYARRTLRAWISGASPTVTERKKVLRALQDFALCDGPLSPEEDLVLSELAALFRLTIKGRVVSSRRREPSARSQGDAARSANRPRRAKEREAAPAIPPCYEILGCSPSDTDEAIKRNYRQLALKLHPDKHSTRPEAATSHVRAFQRLNEAYAEIKRLRAQK